MTTYTTTAKHNDALVDVKYTVDNESREFKIESVHYYGVNVYLLLSMEDIENLEIQIAKDNE